MAREWIVKVLVDGKTQFISILAKTPKDAIAFASNRVKIECVGANIEDFA